MLYRRDRKTGGIASLPIATPAIERAFPDRFIRDADGKLSRIDARPINIEWENKEQLASTLTGKWGGRDPKSVRYALTLSHLWQIADAIRIADAVGPIDRLDDGGQSEHVVKLQFHASGSGAGVALDGNWSNAARFAGDRDLRFSPSTILNLTVYAEPELLWGAEGKWAKDLKLSLEVRNLLNDYRRITGANGATVAGYERDRIDPLGQTVRMTVRKKF